MVQVSDTTTHFRVSFNTDHRGRVVEETRRYEVSFTRDETKLLIHVRAPFFDDPVPSAPPGPTWELWKHEVVEIFFVGPGERYTEIELGPHGHHLVLSLHGIRHIERRLIPIEYAARRDEAHRKTWTGTAKIPFELIPSPTERFNVFAIHGARDNRTYMALYPGVTMDPDFHQIHSYPKAPEELTHLLANDA